MHRPPGIKLMLLMTDRPHGREVDGIKKAFGELRLLHMSFFWHGLGIH